VVEWWSGGVVEWWSGGVLECWSGGDRTAADRLFYLVLPFCPTG
jgi:hypothetical protein